MKKEYLISGNFLGKDIVGLTRKAVQYTLQLDKLEHAKQIHLLVPEDLMEYCPKLNNIDVMKGDRSRSGWNTKVAMKTAKKYGYTYVNFTSPFANMKDSIISMDDVRYMEKNRDGWYDSFKFRLKMYIRAKLGTMMAGRIATVSEFSKERIVKHFRVKPEKIFVISNGWEHINEVEADDGILRKYDDFGGKSYYFTLGSLAKHKNHHLIMELAKNNSDSFFVIGGGIDPEIVFSGSEQRNTDNLVFTGKLTDGEIKALMQKCKAFIFPSFYEGFGIPPLEALACGAQVIVSDIAVHREIFGKSVRYISPYGGNEDLEKLLEETVDSPEDILKKYSWEQAGKEWNKIMYEE